jgi:uncharacterized protein (TIRG00374 family)
VIIPRITERTATTIGDRVEHAIDLHTDVEREIAVGQAETEAHVPSLRRRIFWLVITCISLYLVAPSVLDVLGSWHDVQRLSPAWLLVMLACQSAAIGSLWVLQHLAIQPSTWPAVVSSQLAGNALAKIAPGGGAVGAALQYRMLRAADVPGNAAVSGLTATNILTFFVVLALPVLALPALIHGSVDRTLVEAAVAGVVVFILLGTVVALLLTRDSALRFVGRVVQRVRNRLRRRDDPLDKLPNRLIADRDRMLATLGPHWRLAVAVAVARWTFDYASLLAALAAVHSHPRPGVVLLAFCAAQLLAQIPVTPGGLGFVEAGLTAMLTLAGVTAGDAVLATFAYRLFSYWLALPAGLGGWLWHRHRYGIARTG